MRVRPVRRQHADIHARFGRPVQKNPHSSGKSGFNGGIHFSDDILVHEPIERIKATDDRRRVAVEATRMAISDRTDPDDPIPTALMLAQRVLTRACAMLETTAKPADAGSVRGLLTVERTACGEEPAPLDHARLCAVAHSVAEATRCEVDVTGVAPAIVFTPRDAPLIANLLLLVAEAAGRDGTARLMTDRAGTVVATVAGQNATWPAALPEILFDQGAARAALRSSDCWQAAMTALLVRAAGGRLTMMLPSGPLAAASLTPPLLLTLAAP
jgi:hypothetical protein